MPEGPEIRRAADALEKQIKGGTIDVIYFGLERLKRWQSKLTGAKVLKVETFGKAMAIVLDNGLNVYSHNQLYGRWFFCDTDEYPETTRQLRIAIDCQGKSALLYSASDIAVLNNDELQSHPFIQKLGPDVLSKSTSSEQILGRLLSKKYRGRQLGSVLTDQAFVAGLGNYLRCEILFYSKLHPQVRSNVLDKSKLQMLADTILKLARQSYKSAGITNELNDAAKMMEQGASFEDARFTVFRREGLPCYHCGALIEKFSQAGQTCYICPQCQQK